MGQTRRGLLILFFIVSFQLPAHSLPAFENTAAFLERVERDSVQFFLTYSNPKTGLTPDASTPNAPASIAATGFHLMALIVAAENNWMTQDEAFDQTRRILKTAREKVEHERGFFYHFISHRSGKRVWNSEVSSIDTAIFIANALIAGKYFSGTVVEKMALDLYNRIEWDWMLNGSKMMSHGYKPEVGFLPYYWDTYSEHLILQVLAIGANKHAIPAECWREWFRLEDDYKDYKVVYAHSGSLFTYQMPHLFVDFRKLYDLEKNYFRNSVAASLANKEFCEDNTANYKTYQEGFWGLSASLGPKGYKAYGAKPGRGFHDGTVAPYAIFGSLVFTPEESLSALEKIYENYQDRVYGDSGFRDAFNLEKDWFSRDYIGIDQGMTIGGIENYRSGLIWKLFMSLEATQKWVKLCNIQNAPPEKISPNPAETSRFEKTPHEGTLEPIPTGNPKSLPK